MPGILRGLLLRKTLACTISSTRCHWKIARRFACREDLCVEESDDDGSEDEWIEACKSVDYEPPDFNMNSTPRASSSTGCFPVPAFNGIKGVDDCQGSLIFGSCNGVITGFPALPQHSDIVDLFRDTLRSLRFSDPEIKALLGVRMRRSEVIQKILILDQLWCWPEIKLASTLSNSPRLLGRKPETIIKNMKEFEKLMGRKLFVKVVTRDPDLLNRRPQTLRDASLLTRDYLQKELGVDLEPFQGSLGLSVYRSPPDATRKLVEGLLEILPKWCVRKMFGQKGSQWFTTNLPKLQSSYEALVLEVLLPLVGNDAEKMAHVMIAKYPNLLMIPHEVLQHRCTALQGAFGEATADVIYSHPGLLANRLSRVMEKWHRMVQWTSTNPVWYRELKEKMPQIMGHALTCGSQLVTRLEYLSTFSLSLDQRLWRILVCTKGKFCSEYPGFQHWYQLVHEPESTPNEEYSRFFEFFLKYQWKAFSVRFRPPRHYIADLTTWEALLSPYGLSKHQIVQAVRLKNFWLIKFDPDGQICKQELKMLTNVMGGVDEAGKLIAKFPWVLSCGCGPKLEWLFKLNFTTADICNMIKMYPAILRSHLGNKAAESKLVFLERTMGRSRRETADFPTFWGMSLKKRLLPRYEFIKNNAEQYLDLPLRTMFLRTDKEFCRRINSSQLDFQAFISAYYNRG